MLLEGQQIGGYQFLRLLGSGGMGDVYLAEDRQIGQQVAIKVIRSQLGTYLDVGASEEAIRLFQREAKAIAMLDHPHILPLFAYGEEQFGDTRLVYLVMPYRPEGSLASWVRDHYRGTLMAPEDVAHVVHQAAEALQHAHTHKIIHQDVKPSNFLLRIPEETPTRPELFLADFGIARFMSASSDAASHSVRGTPLYMAPEQCLGAPVLASDQYALAVMAYELLTGRTPFQGTLMQVMYQHINATPEPPSSLNLRLPKSLDAVLLIGLAKKPEERFATVRAFANAFQQALQSSGDADALGLPDPKSIEEATTRIISERGPASSSLPSGPIVPVFGTASLPANPPELPEFAAPTEPNLVALKRPTEDLGAGELPEGASASAAAGPTSSSALLPAMALPGRRGKFSRWQWALLAVTGLLLMGGIFGGIAFAVSGRLRQSPASPYASAATVTITPASKMVQGTFTIHAVTGAPEAAQQQVYARQLSYTDTHSETVNATGQGQIPGTDARGTLAFCTTYPGGVVETAGTVYTDNFGGTANVTIVLDVTVTVPQSSASCNNIVFSSGHVQTPGSAGNIAADTFKYGDGPHQLIVTNSSAFTGGKDPQPYTFVEQSDLNNATNSLISSYAPNPQTVFANQIKGNEALVNTPQCSSSTGANHKAGDRTPTVTVTVTFSCSAEVYDKAGALALARELLASQAATDPGSPYGPVGTAQATIGNVSAPDSQGTITLMVSAQGVWAYQFSDVDKQGLARLIAGLTPQQASALILEHAGVANVAIQLSDMYARFLPSDPKQIMIVTQIAPAS